MNIVNPRLRIGQILISRYEIIGEIGQGGMQQVFLCKDRALNRQLALKVPINASAQKRFERSARLSAAIAHPNIAKTLDYGSEGDLEFLIEELIPGHDLQHRIDSDFGRLDPHMTAHLVHHLSKAVAAMNRQSVIHRDLKPSNIMVSDDDGMIDVKVTDFGVATMADAEINAAVDGGLSSIAASKTVVGALAFMAPELIKKGSAVERGKCDVWSIGALLYYLLFGDYPFGKELAAIQNILNGTYPDRTVQVNTTKIQFRDLVSSLWEITKLCLNSSVPDRPTADDVVSLFSKITYSIAKRNFGHISYLNSGTGAWGFIRPEVGGRDVFFHFDSFIGGQPCVGMRVTYSSFPGQPQERAFPVAACLEKES